MPDRRPQNVWEAVLAPVGEAVQWAGQQYIPFQRMEREEERLEKQLAMGERRLGLREREVKLDEAEWKLTQPILQAEAQRTAALGDLRTQSERKQLELEDVRADNAIKEAMLLQQELAVSGTIGEYQQRAAEREMMAEIARAQKWAEFVREEYGGVEALPPGMGIKAGPISITAPRPTTRTGDLTANQAIQMQEDYRKTLIDEKKAIRRQISDWMRADMLLGGDPNELVGLEQDLEDVQRQIDEVNRHLGFDVAGDSIAEPDATGLGPTGAMRSAIIQAANEGQVIWPPSKEQWEQLKADNPGVDWGQLAKDFELEFE